MKQLYTNNTNGKGNTKEYIVLHHTATGYNTVNGVANAFMGARPVSAHYLIDTNGAVYKFNSDDDILRHAGESYREGKTELNNYSIGIEFIGPLPGFTDAQRNAGRKLITELMTKHNIPNTKVIRHKDIAPSRKVDIDDSFWNTTFDSFQEYQKSFRSKNKNEMDKIKQIQHDYKKNDGNFDSDVDLAENIQDTTLRNLYFERSQLCKKINIRIREMKLDPK